MALTPEDVVNQKFTITKFRDGYDLDQVDDFLDQIVEMLREHDEEKSALKQEIEELTAKLAECEAGAGANAAAGDASEQTIVVDAPEPVAAPVAAAAPAAAVAGGAQPDAIKSSAMLQLALELHDKHVHDGETTRDELVAEGEKKARELVSEAEKQRSDVLDDLNGRRLDLQNRINDLRDFESEYRGTLRSYIEAQLRNLDGSPEPGDKPGSLN